MFTRLPHAVQVTILQLADNHVATVGACKSMKVAADEVQVVRRKELVADIPDWEASWDAFAFITKKEWGVDGYVSTCKCAQPGDCWECEVMDRSQEIEWEMEPRHFPGETYTLKRMVSQVFGDRCLVGLTDHRKPPPFDVLSNDLLIVFRHRAVLVATSSAGGVEVTLRDHAHGGIQPVLISQRWREKTDQIPNQGDPQAAFARMIGEAMFIRAAEMASQILPVLGKKDFSIKVDNVHMLRPGRFWHLRHFPDYDEGVLMDEMNAACKKHRVSIVPDDDVSDAIVMLAWENGPITFNCHGVLFTSKELEKLVSEHVRQRL
jgi:hypothetical protein